MIKPNKVGLVLGALVAGFHLVWIILIAAGWAQPILNFVFWAHMIRPIYMVGPFNAVAALTLLVITFFSGYVFGFIGGTLWNRLHR